MLPERIREKLTAARINLTQLLYLEKTQEDKDLAVREVNAAIDEVIAWNLTQHAKEEER